MTRTILLLSVVLCLIKWSFASTCTDILEPCYLHHNMEIPNMESRHPDIMFSTSFQADYFCDKYALNSNTWYRSDYNMTTQIVQQQGCGTDEPIWLNGSIPGPEDGVVSREACVRSYSEACSFNYTLYIRNCHFYTVYCLVSLPYSCYQRYCFDVNLTAITTTTTTTTKTTTSTMTTRLPIISSTDRPEPPRDNCPPVGEISDSNEGLAKNGLAAAILTLCCCIVFFGTMLVVFTFALPRNKIPKKCVMPNSEPLPYEKQIDGYN